MSSIDIVEIENKQLDSIKVENLFQFSFHYNIDVLKQAIEALIYNQKVTNQRITELELKNIEVNEKLQKQEVTNEVMKESTDHIQHYFGDNENFKKSLEDLKKHLSEIEKQKNNTIEENTQKQIEELHQNITNIYKNRFSDQGEEHKDDYEERLEKLESEITLLKELVNKSKIGNSDNSLDTITEKKRKLEENNKKRFSSMNLRKKTSEDNKEKNGNNKEGNSPKEVTDEGKEPNEKTKFSKEEDKGQNQNTTINEQTVINLINKSIIGKKLNQFDSNFSDFILLKQEIKDIIEMTGEKNFESAIKKVVDKVDKLEKSLLDLSTKLQEFDVMELFLGKNKSEEDNNKQIDAIKTVFQGFEKKMLNKISITDEKFKKNEEDIYKLKNELTNIRLINDGLLSSEKELKKSDLQQEERINKMYDDIKKREEKMKEKFESDLNNLHNYIDSKTGGHIVEPSIHISSKAIENEDEEKSRNFSPLAGDDRIGKRLTDLEKNYKILSLKSNNVDKLGKDLALLNESLNLKVTKTELNELKENLAQTSNQLNFLKDNFIQILEDRKAFDDITALRRKIDTITSTIATLKNIQGNDDSSQAQANRYSLESYRFLETTVFNEFQKYVKKELENLVDRLDGMRNTIDENIIVNLKLKANAEDLKSLEEFLISRLEDLKHGSTKKFADKNEINKSIRYLDTQIKHILDVYIKKIEKGDNWLLAKKPFSGNFCASCENPIGELHENNQFVAWNKIHPQQNERVYRLGSGFSKMLQNLNLESTEKVGDEGEAGRKIHSRNKSYNQSGGLNRIHSFRTMSKVAENSMDVSNENIKMDHTLNEVYDDKNKPRVVKIYKVKKEKKEER